MAMTCHLAMPDEWAVAEKAGAYTQSTRGLSLAAAGFIHCSRADQWHPVRALLYADVPDAGYSTAMTASRLSGP